MNFSLVRKTPSFLLAGSLTISVLLGCGHAQEGPVVNTNLGLKDSIEKSGGDYNKLSAEYKKQVDDASRGHGVQYVQSKYKAMHP